MISNVEGEQGWPDWTGETAVVVGTGPSASGVPLHLAQDVARFVVIKSSWQLAPWADVLFGMDRGWWLANKGAPEFRGLHATASPTIAKCFPGTRLVKIIPRPGLHVARVGSVGGGSRRGHSGFCGVNLAVQLGATRVVLVGFDMTLANGAHWRKADPGVGRPDKDRVAEWRAGLDGCAEQFLELGIDVINCSPVSALRAYRKVAFEQVFADARHDPEDRDARSRYKPADQ